MKHAGIPWKLHGTPVAIRDPAPCIGEDNAYVVVEVLGRDRREYERLVDSGVLYQTDSPSLVCGGRTGDRGTHVARACLQKAHQSQSRIAAKVRPA